MVTKRRELTAVCLSLLVIVMLLTGSSVAQNTGGTIKIGGLWPLSGGASTIGTQERDGMQFAIDEINAAGGIKSMGGAKLEAVYADTQSRPDVAVSQADRLLGREKVALLIGAYRSADTFPVTDVAERYGIPMLSQGAVKNEITERHYKNVFRINNKAAYDVNEMTTSLALFAKEKKFEVKTIGFVYDSSDWGADTAKIMREYAAKAGWKDVLSEPVTSGQTDMSPIMLKIKRATPDVLFLALYTPEHILFNKTYAANKMSIKFGLWSAGAGSEDPAFYKVVSNDMTEFMFVQDDWDTGGPAREPWKAKIAKACKDKFGYAMGTYWSQGYAAAYVAKEIFEKAKSTDPAVLRKTASQVDITSGPALVVGYQRIKFDENGQNTFAHGTISQRQGGKRIVLWPDKNKTPGAGVILPVPDWANRKSVPGYSEY